MPVEFVVSGETKCIARGCGREDVENTFSTINYVGGNLRSQKETRFNGRSTNGLNSDSRYRIAKRYMYNNDYDLTIVVLLHTAERQITFYSFFAFLIFN